MGNKCVPYWDLLLSLLVLRLCDNMTHPFINNEIYAQCSRQQSSHMRRIKISVRSLTADVLSACSGGPQYPCDFASYQVT